LDDGWRGNEQVLLYMGYNLSCQPQTYPVLGKTTGVLPSNLTVAWGNVSRYLASVWIQL
jgi:hypothetical protein